MKSVVKKEIRPHSFAAWMAFMRPKTFWIAAAPVCVGTAFAGALAGTWNLWIFLFTLLGAVSIQAMSNMVNDYAYNLKKAENGTRVGLPRATTKGWISMSAAKKMVGFSIVICSLFGILLIVIGGLPIACIAVLSLILYGRTETYRLHAFRRIFSFSFLRSFRSQRNLLASNA